MNALLDRIAARPAGAVALDGGAEALDGPALAAEVRRVAAALRAARVEVLATLLDNGPAWIVADLAALVAGVVHVPLPSFFTPGQVAHALDRAGVDALLAQQRREGWDATSFGCAGTPMLLLRRAPSALAATRPAGTAKITFTSGTTGTPKGVCLDADAMLAVARSVAEALAPVGIERHLVALPLAVLLENVAGVYAPLWQGATVVAPPLAEVGLSGSSSFDPARLDAAAAKHRAHSVITLPQMLRAWTAWRAATTAPPLELRFVAVGGAAAGEALVRAARAAGLPAYEGYGLSEGCSVQTLNLPGADRPGGVGRALPHARVEVDAGGEVVVSGALMLGYLGTRESAPVRWRTGDLGAIDADGMLELRGRSRDVIVTGFGRNVSPEWVETALRAQPAIREALVLGEGRPALGAVLWPSPAANPTALRAAVAATNATLPDYARIAAWTPALAPFDAAAGTATSNGRPRRDAIATMHLATLWPQDEKAPDVLP